MREGDVYTHILANENYAGINSGKRPFIIIEVQDNDVIAVPLTTRLNQTLDINRVYSQLTVNGITKPICILADLPFQIPKAQLLKKIAHIEPGLMNEIIQKSKNSNQKNELKDEQIYVTDEDEMMSLLKNIDYNVSELGSKKKMWIERIFSFVLGIFASLIASFLFIFLS